MEDDRRCALKKAIIDYVLLDSKEQTRLGVPVPPKVRFDVLAFAHQGLLYSWVPL